VRARWGLAWSLFGCSPGPDSPEHRALAERVDHLQRRIDALEADRARLQAEAAKAEPAGSQPTATPPGRKDEVLTLHLGIDGVAIAGRRIAADALDAELRGLASGQSIHRVLIEADERIEHARVVELIDRVRSAGFERFAIASRGGKREPEAELPDEPEPELTAR